MNVHKFRMIPMAGVVLIAAAGCAASQTSHDTLHADVVLVGRVTGMKEMGVFEIGDVEEAWTVYDFQTALPSETVQFISSGENCWIEQDSTVSYLVILH